eukprot:TRINITY_DN9613_c0_g1_i11.p5 TRINITY_DN9613_c0_g1~~TRINITY_DN9613_c0_g1_i11.p5  ORF type:complete len:222 (-),score=81.23 TRINITY_DN9613_c0_g1_i11:944-1609(-)
MGKPMYAELEVAVTPRLSASEELNEYCFNVRKESYRGASESKGNAEVMRSLESLPEEYKAAVKEAVHNSLLAGKVLGYKMIGVKVEVIGGKWSNERSSETSFRLCASELLNQCLREASPCLLEPYVEVTLTIPETSINEVLSNMAVNRRGEVKRIEDVGMIRGSESSRKKITAVLPLAELNGYGNYIRIVTKGQGLYTSEFYEYRPMSEEETRKVLENSFN